MSYGVQHIFIKFVMLLIVAPQVAWLVVKLIDLGVDPHKINEKKRKHLVNRALFGVFIGFLGWFR
jgi:hypothetical protein